MNQHRASSKQTDAGREEAALQPPVDVIEDAAGIYHGADIAERFEGMDAARGLHGHGVGHIGHVAVRIVSADHHGMRARAQQRAGHQGQGRDPRHHRQR